MSTVIYAAAWVVCTALVVGMELFLLGSGPF